jgi:hypothetical protein
MFNVLFKYRDTLCGVSFDGDSFPLSYEGHMTSRFPLFLSACPSLLSVSCFVTKIYKHECICLLKSEYAFKPVITILVYTQEIRNKTPNFQKYPQLL